MARGDGALVGVLLAAGALGLAAWYFFFRQKCPDGERWDEATQKCVPDSGGGGGGGGGATCGACSPGALLFSGTGYGGQSACASTPGGDWPNLNHMGGVAKSALMCGLAWVRIFSDPGFSGRSA